MCSSCHSRERAAQARGGWPQAHQVLHTAEQRAVRPQLQLLHYILGATREKTAGGRRRACLERDELANVAGQAVVKALRGRVQVHDVDGAADAGAVRLHLAAVGRLGGGVESGLLPSGERCTHLAAASWANHQLCVAPHGLLEWRIVAKNYILLAARVAAPRRAAGCRGQLGSD